MRNDPLDQLFEQYLRELSGYLTQQLGCRELAADLCQEVYLRLRRVETPLALDNPRAFLFRIARNLMIDHRRRQHTQAATFAPPDPQVVIDELESDAPTPESAASSARALSDLRLALDELPAHVRKALLWNRLDGLTQREIGERLGVSERMAGKYILRALSHCQARLPAELRP
ncbi:RNA polymerase sigma factor [Alloalcanivorax mobilis]|uniref:RNA polymerase sigma factor n=1 Tax=Alloalcanivorax mobilis TaxID=2019569 RepID=UPI000C7594B0|nr:RNA polymerase sigma factor [Alloalcanivorax mobilis]|tara:strand:- start:15613 stop:16131 length:519 start_codon:yes stop_codon:yes gene_type:complete